MDKISLLGQRAIVTGSGKGIGRAHALELARRGAAVVVNDVDRAAADAVVQEITASGGSAIASYDAVGSKAAGQSLVDLAVEAFGGLEIVINNAGFLRPDYFENMSEERIDAILDVHLKGSIYVTQAAWPIMQRQNYGRVVMTGSSSGMFAHQGQINYCAAKAGVYGLTKALAYEGLAHNINVNILLPGSPTGIDKNDPIPDMVANYAKFVTPEMRAKLDKTNRSPEMISHMAVYLVSRECDLTGEAFSVYAGRYARVFVGVADGWLTKPEETVTAEAVRDHLAQIRDLSSYSVPKWLFEEVSGIGSRL